MQIAQRLFTQESLFFMFTYDLSIFLTSTAFVDTNTKIRYASFEIYRIFENCPLEYVPYPCRILAWQGGERKTRQRKRFICVKR